MIALSNSASSSLFSPMRLSMKTDDLPLCSYSFSSVFFLLSMARERARPTRCCSPLCFLPRMSNLRRDHIVSKGLSLGTLGFMAATAFGPNFLCFFFFFDVVSELFLIVVLAIGCELNQKTKNPKELAHSCLPCKEPRDETKPHCPKVDNKGGGSCGVNYFS
uniref:Uncharacterized protein n=1 Tax=Rhizophora mucronata TaxID=61149 RepID=A0A2P2LIA7_RHIMU